MQRGATPPAGGASRPLPEPSDTVLLPARLSASFRAWLKCSSSTLCHSRNQGSLLQAPTFCSCLKQGAGHGEGAGLVTPAIAAPPAEFLIQRLWGRSGVTARVSVSSAFPGDAAGQSHS